MKKILTFASTLIFFTCPACSQNKPAKLIIDKDLKNNLFEFLPYGVHGGPKRTYIDSVLVYSNDSSTDYQFISNAKIIDVKKRHPQFDTCRSYFSEDTLIVELRSIASFSNDELIIKIKNKKYWTYLGNKGANIRSIGKPKSLIFKNKIKKRGQEIFGELIIDFPNENINQSYTFYGPFRCIIE